MRSPRTGGQNRDSSSPTGKRDGSIFAPFPPKNYNAVVNGGERLYTRYALTHKKRLLRITLRLKGWVGGDGG